MLLAIFEYHIFGIRAAYLNRNCNVMKIQSKSGFLTSGFLFIVFLSLSLCKYCFIRTNYIRKLSGFLSIVFLVV